MKKILGILLFPFLAASCEMLVEAPQGLEIPAPAPQDNIVEYQG